jgi:hypothetical protein
MVGLCNIDPMTNPRISVAAAISHSYKAFNEDLWGYATNRFWVLDGATGLSDRTFFHHVSDILACATLSHLFHEQ